MKFCSTNVLCADDDNSKLLRRTLSDPSNYERLEKFALTAVVEDCATQLSNARPSAQPQLRVAFQSGLSFSEMNGTKSRE